MCELFALSSDFPATVDLSLEAFSRHGGLSGPHKDGWGIAYYEGGDVRLIRDTTAADVLKGIEKLEDNPYVVTGRKEGSRLTDLQHPWRRIRAKAGFDDVRIHDLRHSYASGALALGEGLPMIGKLLGHTQVQTTARYAHLANDPVKSAAGRVSDTIGAAMLGRKRKAMRSARSRATGKCPKRIVREADQRVPAE
ncbi:MAG: class II glutamine amidotransferase [Dongiaceae bacterium]